MTNLEARLETFPDGSRAYGNPGDKIIGPSREDVEWANQFNNELAKEDIVVASKGSLLGKIAEATLGRIPKRLVIPTAGALALLAAACSGGGANQAENTITNTPDNSPTATSTLQPSVNPASSSTIVPTEAPTIAPTATKTPEQVKETPCEILPTELCSKAEVLKYETLKGDEVIMLGFKDLPPETKIKAVSDATVTPGVFAETDSWKGSIAFVELDSEGEKLIVIRGDIAFDSLKQLSVKKGDIITTVKGTGDDNFGYNLLINFVIKENGKYVDNTELLEALFPGITSKAPVRKIEETAINVIRSTEYFPEYESPPSGASTR